MLQAYNPKLCRTIILVLGAFAILAILSISLITAFTLPANVMIKTLSDEGLVGGIIIVMTTLAFFNQLNLAGLVWGFAMPFAIMFVLAKMGAPSDVLGVLILLIVVDGILLAPRVVLMAGILEAVLFVIASYLNGFQFLNYGAGSELRSEVDNLLFIIFTTVVMSLLGNGMLQILEKLRQQAEQLQINNQNLQKQQAFQNHTSIQINYLASTLGDYFREQRKTTLEQVEVVNEVSTTAQQLDAAARRIAESALAVAAVAENALKSVESGRQTAEDGTKAIVTLRGRVEHITESMRALNNQIERISEVISVIGEIASETQLLALNATIEAAGAREFGRRFGAVAEEVSRLSRRVSEAVEQIQETVTEVSEASIQSLKVTEDGLRQARQGTEMVERFASANNDVIQLVNQTSVLASRIANATQEQHKASSQIAAAVRSISSSSEQMSRIGEKVSNVVTELEESLRMMNVGENDFENSLSNDYFSGSLDFEAAGSNLG